MRVAVFSDVHGNLLALERFVRATRNDVDAYMCLGDVVDYGPWNDECLEMVRQLPGITVLEGNHERLFLGAEDPDHEPPLVQAFFRHSRQFFSREDLIAGLPSRSELGIFECVHTIDGRSIFPDTSIEIDRNYMVGHTHRQFHIHRSGFAIVNPGSVGQNRRWIDMIDYSIFDTGSGAVDPHSIHYNVALFLSELHQRRYPEQCIEYYANKPRHGA
jgi:predicted phosphodiesterase